MNGTSVLVAEPDWYVDYRACIGQAAAVPDPVEQTWNGVVDMGVFGLGKLNVSRALSAQGHATHDADEEGIRTWRRLSTGEPVDWLGWPVPPDWHEEHHMPVNPDRVEELKGAIARSPS